MAAAKKSILIIDDDRVLLKLAGSAFKKKGYNVYEATNGVEGLEKLDMVEPDLIILDLKMPKMGGVEFYSRICNSDNMPEYPIFIITAREDVEHLFKDFFM